MIKKVLSKISNWSLGEKILFAFLLISQVYYSYRYIFRFGSEISSPGYNLTPPIFQYLKYFISFIFLVFLVFYILYSKDYMSRLIIFKNKILILIGIAILYIFVSLLKYNNFSSFEFTQLIKMSFVLPFALIIPFIIKKNNLKDFVKYLLFFSVSYHLIFNTLAIILFFIFGIFPGMDLGNHVGRFGGGWDDPNSFAALLTLFFIILNIFYKKHSTNSKKIYLINFVIVAFLVLTYSISGLIGYLFSLFLLFITKKIDYKNIIIIILSFIFMAIMLFSLGYLQAIYNDKSGSLKQHVEMVKTEDNKEMNNYSNPLIGTFINPKFNENFYLQFINNFGIIGFALFSSMIFILYRDLIIYFRKRYIKDNFDSYLILTAIIYMPAFLIMNLGIPYFQVYPINLIFWVLFALSVYLLYFNNSFKKTN